jgi:hypothetical protein
MFSSWELKLNNNLETRFCGRVAAKEDLFLVTLQKQRAIQFKLIYNPLPIINKGYKNQSNVAMERR